MLSFAAPIRLIDGHAVFSDFDDPDLFYVMPRSPRLEVGDDGKPSYSLTQYLNLSDNDQDTVWGGFLSVSTMFGLEQDRLSSVHDKLKQEVSGNVRVVPVPYHSGEVRLILLGQDSDNSDASDDNEDQEESVFDLDILCSGKPSLDGLGSASFLISLDGKAASLLDQAIDKSSLPALINYSMVVEGMRPGFNVKVTADWSRVYEELTQKLNANIYYVRADLENTVKETFEDANVKIETVIEDSALADEAKEAEKALVDWALNVFFKSSHSKQNGASDLINGIADGVGSLVSSLMPGVSLKLKSLREEEVKTFHAQLDRVIAERRTFTFDGTLGQAIHSYRFDEDGNEKGNWHELRKGLVQRVDIPETPQLSVNLSVVDRFQLDGITSVKVEVARKSQDDFVDIKQFNFDAANDTFSYLVSLLEEGAEALGQPYYYRVSTKFNPSTSFGSSEDAVGNWIESRSKNLLIDPRADTPYAMTTVAMQAEAGFPFNQFEEVTVELRVPDTVNGEEVQGQHHRIVLTQNQKSANWQFRSDIPALYDYRVTYLKPAGTGENVVTDWIRTSSPLLTINNPAPAARRLNIINNLPWDRISFASLEINYEDEENDIHINEQIALDRATPMVQKSYAIAQRKKQSLTYRLTVLFTTGQFLVGDWRESNDSSLIISKNLVEERNIRILMRSTNLSEHDLKDIKLELEAVNDSGDVLHTTSMQVKSDNERFSNWSYPLGDPPIKNVKVKAKFTASDGFSKTQDWQETQRDLLIIDLAQQAVIL